MRFVGQHFLDPASPFALMLAFAALVPVMATRFALPGMVSDVGIGQQRSHDAAWRWQSLKDPAQEQVARQRTCPTGGKGQQRPEGDESGPYSNIVVQRRKIYANLGGDLPRAKPLESLLTDAAKSSLHQSPPALLTRTRLAWSFSARDSLPPSA